MPHNALSAVRTAVTEAVTTTFAELTGTAVRLVREDATPGFDGAVAAHLPLKGDPPGVVLLELPAALADTLAGRYLTPNVELTPGLVADAVGEFVNVIAGQVKTSLKGTARHFHLATPMPGLPAVVPAGALVLLFACPDGLLRLTVDVPVHETPLP